MFSVVCSCLFFAWVCECDFSSRFYCLLVASVVADGYLVYYYYACQARNLVDVLVRWSPVTGGGDARTLSYSHIRTERARALENYSAKE